MRKIIAAAIDFDMASTDLLARRTLEHWQFVASSLGSHFAAITLSGGKSVVSGEGLDKQNVRVVYKQPKDQAAGQLVSPTTTAQARQKLTVFFLHLFSWCKFSSGVGIATPQNMKLVTVWNAVSGRASAVRPCTAAGRAET